MSKKSEEPSEFDPKCHSCSKDVSPENVIKKSAYDIYCPHCGTNLIQGVFNWIKPHYTLKEDYKPITFEKKD